MARFLGGSLRSVARFTLLFASLGAPFALPHLQINRRPLPLPLPLPRPPPKRLPRILAPLNIPKPNHPIKVRVGKLEVRLRLQEEPLLLEPVALASFPPALRVGEGEAPREEEPFGEVYNRFSTPDSLGSGR